ncbi:hypothetical protein JCM10212_002244 [Sporobolomyces blumeae]
MDPSFDPNVAFPPLRPAAYDPDPSRHQVGTTGQHGEIAPVKEIEEHEVEMYKEQDRYLPIANVGRIMKKCLPETTKVSKDAKECVQECTSEFISFITSEAAERCQVEKRKTINGEDILFAMTTLGFENYAEVLKVYLAKYREHQRSTGKRAQKRAAKEAALAQSQAAETGDVGPRGDDEEDAEGDDGEEYGELFEQG